MDVRHRERGHRRVPVVEAQEPRSHLGIVKTGEPIAITGVASLLRDTWRGLASSAVIPGQLSRRQQVEHCLTSGAAERAGHARQPVRRTGDHSAGTRLPRGAGGDGRGRGWRPSGVGPGRRRHPRQIEDQRRGRVLAAGLTDARQRLRESGSRADTCRIAGGWPMARAAGGPRRAARPVQPAATQPRVCRVRSAEMIDRESAGRARPPIPGGAARRARRRRQRHRRPRAGVRSRAGRDGARVPLRDGGRTLHDAGPDGWRAADLPPARDAIGCDSRPSSGRLSAGP